MGFVDDFCERHRKLYDNPDEKYYDRYLKTEKIFIESDNDKTIIDDRKDLFSWDNIPGNDHERFIEFLNRRFGRRLGIDWLRAPKIEKIDSGKTIKVFAERNYLLLRLDEKKNKINVKFDDGRTDEFIAKKENNKLKIYDLKSRNDSFEKLCKSCKEIYKCHLKNEFIDLCPKIISK